MKKGIIYTAFLILTIALTACQSDFERVRASGDPTYILTRANEFSQKGDYLKAQALYEQIMGSFRGKSEAEGLYYSYAETHYHLANYVLAAHYFNSFANTFPTSSKREEALYMSAICNVKMSPEPALDQKYTVTAIEELQMFANLYPASPRIPEVNNQIDQLRQKLEAKEFRSAKLYYDMKQYQSASRSLKNLLQDYPETSKADEIRFLIIKSSYLMAKNSVVSRQEERYEEVLTEFSNYRTRIKSAKYDNELNSIIKDSESRLKLLKNG